MTKYIELPFDCPHCGERIEDDRDYEVATVGNLFDPAYPHLRCPHCGECCGCRPVPEENEQ